MLRLSPSGLRRFVRDQGGAAATEYAIVIGLGAALAIPALTFVGLRLSDTLVAVTATSSNDVTGSIAPAQPGLVGVPAYAPSAAPAVDPGSPSLFDPPAPAAPDPAPPVWTGP